MLLLVCVFYVIMCLSIVVALTAGSLVTSIETLLHTVAHLLRVDALVARVAREDQVETAV